MTYQPNDNSFTGDVYVLQIEVVANPGESFGFRFVTGYSKLLPGQSITGEDTSRLARRRRNSPRTLPPGLTGVSKTGKPIVKVGETDVSALRDKHLNEEAQQASNDLLKSCAEGIANGTV